MHAGTHSSHKHPHPCGDPSNITMGFQPAQLPCLGPGRLYTTLAQTLQTAFPLIHQLVHLEYAKEWHRYTTAYHVKVTKCCGLTIRQLCTVRCAPLLW